MIMFRTIHHHYIYISFAPNVAYIYLEKTATMISGRRGRSCRLAFEAMSECCRRYRASTVQSQHPAVWSLYLHASISEATRSTFRISVLTEFTLRRSAHECWYVTIWASGLLLCSAHASLDTSRCFLTVTASHRRCNLCYVT